jgi:hypothetical protein
MPRRSPKHGSPPRLEIPDDIRAENDVEERLGDAAAEQLPAADVVPEDVLGERDHEARLASARDDDEGQAPAEEDARS